ncbi:hypothetical protein BKA62DRAFT_206441 [Auriculariales sp. MPI-PUGE-AT-0066]|nr:hypothetical protein BKA62DRAFT_206441 [Auriculariales sp. MPI-PUGE-AT-0066]
MMATHRLEDNQRREHEEQHRERERQTLERERQGREREEQRRERERVLMDKLKPILAGTAMGKDAPSGCMQDTRVDLLRDITDWASNPGRSIFWLTGLAGTGKTAASKSAADRLTEAGFLVVSFFISRHAGQRSDQYNIIHTMVFELARVHDAARTTILKAFEDDPRLPELNLDEQVTRLLIEPLRAVSAASSNSRIVLLLDALDECDDPAAFIADGCLGRLIPALGSSAGGGTVKLYLTSRPMDTVGPVVESFMVRLGQQVKLHEIETSGDIRTYLERSLLDVRIQRKLPEGWPSAEELDSLVQRAGSFFIYATTVVRHIRQLQYSPRKRLTELLSVQVTEGDHDSPYGEVDRLYVEVLSLFTNPGSSGAVGKHTSLTHRLRRVLAAVVLGREPMSPQLISSLLNIDLEELEPIVSGLSAIWVTPKSVNDPIVLYHESFPDFLVDIRRCEDSRFSLQSSAGEEWLATGCLLALNQLLVRDICQIPLATGQALPHRDSIGDIGDRLAHFVPMHLRYSCLHLLHHVNNMALLVNLSEEFIHNLTAFCRQKLLFWLELTCLMGSSPISNLILQLMRLSPTLLDHDGIAECGILLRQFSLAVQYFEEPLCASHAEVYNSFLAFIPDNVLREAYAACKDSSRFCRLRIGAIPRTAGL